MINDTQSLVGARQSQAWDEYGSPITVYDDGFGSLWLYREAGGLQGIVRAMSWEAAYEICQDEIMTRVSPDEFWEAYGLYMIPYNGELFICPDVELQNTGTYWETFNRDIPGRLVVGKFNSWDEVKLVCSSIIENNQLDLIEGYEYQPNATGTGIVSFDLNGQSLEELTPELAERLGIRIQIEESDI